MKYKEFLSYLQTNLTGYQTFMFKAMQFQRVKNAKRQKKDRWEDKKLEKAAVEM